MRPRRQPRGVRRLIVRAWREWGRGDSPPAREPSDAGACPQDVARLIVERSTIMSHLFSKRSCSAESDAVLAALLSIFSRYVRRMRKSKDGEEVYSWVRRAAAPPQPQPRPAPPRPSCPLSLQSESQDQVFLRWTSGETATMHILVVHAMVILLTLGPPRGERGLGGAQGRPVRLLEPARPLLWQGCAEWYSCHGLPWSADGVPSPSAGDGSGGGM